MNICSCLHYGMPLSRTVLLCAGVLEGVDPAICFCVVVFLTVAVTWMLVWRTKSYAGIVTAWNDYRSWRDSKRFVALCHWKETNKHKDWTILLRVILICVRTKAASHGHRKWKTGDILLSDGCFVASGERNNLWFEGRAMFHHARLPARYFLLCCFLIISLWLFFNFMSFMYVAGERKHTLPGTARHLQGNSLVADFSFNLDQQDISLLGLIRTDEDKRVRELGYSRYAFNELISNRLGFHRSVKDTRHKL